MNINLISNIFSLLPTPPWLGPPLPRCLTQKDTYPSMTHIGEPLRIHTDVPEPEPTIEPMPTLPEVWPLVPGRVPVEVPVRMRRIERRTYV